MWVLIVDPIKDAQRQLKASVDGPMAACRSRRELKKSG